jgi:hypothetical protein
MLQDFAIYMVGPAALTTAALWVFYPWYARKSAK